MTKGFILSFIFAVFSIGILANSTLPPRCLGTLPDRGIRIELKLEKEGIFYKYKILNYDNKQTMYILSTGYSYPNRWYSGTIAQVVMGVIGSVSLGSNSSSWMMSLDDNQEGTLVLQFNKSHPLFPNHNYGEQYHMFCNQNSIRGL